MRLIIACDNKGGIGFENKLPWGFGQKDDLKRFQEITNGHCVMMGRKTFESLPGLLKDRVHIVISTTMNPQPGILVVRSVSAAKNIVELLKTPVFLIGGADMVRQFIDAVDEIYLTKIKGEFEADAFFDLKQLDNFRLVYNESFEANERNTHPYVFQTWRRSYF